ncbi:PglL family O-oligosaccharyltransferase [Polaromonas sp. A23]|uniref:PglL family O-oligosaccharyltransferase n=1 Tax=Polaromonas sp. A23 TaxID=1944133 RepID=UPI00098760B8|nr:Wzy polymerase domain-containing protein [Polaromonas sp. A23]OOG48398.1 polymerase [Polaromonas sp. A23]
MQLIALFLLLALPWLNPFAPGPVPAAVPLLFSWFCTAALLAAGSRVPILAPAGRLVAASSLAWLGAGLLSSVMGLWQYLGAGDSFLPWINQARLGEAFANLRQRNQFASLTSVALVVLLWMPVNFTRNVDAARQFDSKYPWVAPLAAGLLAAGNAASSSRTGLLQLFLICALCWIWGGWRQPFVRRVLLAAVLAYVLAALVLPWLGGLDLMGHGMVARLRAGDAVCTGRLTLWANVLTLIAQKPWFGWGWGELDYAHYMTLFPGGRFCDILDNAHNLPLHLAVELGIPTALTVCAALGWIVWRTRPLRETNSARQMAWSVLAVIMLHSLLEYPLWYGPFQMAVGLCVWMLWVTPRERIAGNPDGSLVALVVRLALASALSAAVAYAAWDYHRVSQIYRAPEMRDPAYRGDTVSKIRGSWLFRNQVRFAELTTTVLKRDNAQWTFDTATGLLHFSPEPRVIEKVIESAVMLGRDDEALLHLVRYRAAFPKEYERWRQVNGLAGAPAD